MTYSEKLKDPRWQKLRLEVFERDGWKCTRCESTVDTLCVHHLYYEEGKEPWEHPKEGLITLCEWCHEDEKGFLPHSEKLLLKAVRKCFTSTGIMVLSKGFRELSERGGGGDATAGDICAALKNPQIMKWLQNYRDAHTVRPTQ